MSWDQCVRVSDPFPCRYFEHFGGVLHWGKFCSAPTVSILSLEVDNPLEVNFKWSPARLCSPLFLKVRKWEIELVFILPSKDWPGLTLLSFQYQPSQAFHSYKRLSFRFLILVSVDLISGMEALKSPLHLPLSPVLLGISLLSFPSSSFLFLDFCVSN